MSAYTKSADLLLTELNSDKNNGLSSEKVAILKEKFGANKLREKKKKSNIERFIDQFKDVMEQKLKPKNEGIFANGLAVKVVLQGMMFAILTLIGFKVGENVTGSLSGGQTLAFITLALSQVVQAFNMRSEHSLFKIGFFTNKKLNLAALTSTLLVLLILFTPLKIAFGLITLPLKLYLLCLALVLIPLVIMELSKLFRLIKKRK